MRFNYDKYLEWTKKVSENEYKKLDGKKVEKISLDKFSDFYLCNGMEVLEDWCEEDDKLILIDNDKTMLVLKNEKVINIIYDTLEKENHEIIEHSNDEDLITDILENL